ncbi:MAG: polysaccharide deacetylase family protein [Oscillospiraceae bacterium]|nr:polysaccharide deacetylase family protein [Oscillospiraceae bacterium]
MLKKFIGILKYSLAAAACIGMVSITAYALDNTCKGYGQGRDVDENNRPVGAEMFNSEMSQYGGYAMFDDNGKIVLTFDQGYENGYTTPILDALKEKDVKAVFFVTGDYVKRNADLVKRMIDEGHVIGNHGMAHASLPNLTRDEAINEIMSLHDYVVNKFGYEMKYFRPPCGEYSEQAVALAQELGYTTMLWSFAYKDWEVNCQPDPAEAFDRVSGAAHGGAIYLLHSVSATNAEILPQVIDCLKEQGYDFCLPEV